MNSSFSNRNIFQLSKIYENNDLIIKSDKTNIHRCEKCYSIPLFGIKYFENIPYLIYRCENSHFSYLSETFSNVFERTLKKFDYIKCNQCENTKKLYNKFFICSKCKLFFCENHVNHQNKEHILIDLKKFDGVCKQHNKILFDYCDSCQKNLCKLCLNNHKFHNIIHIQENFIYDEEIHFYKKKIKQCENFIKNVEKDFIFIKNYFEESFKKFKSFNILELNLIKNLIETYENKIENDQYNFEIIKNIKNVINFSDYIKFNLNDDINKNNNNNIDLQKLINNYINNSKIFILKESKINLITKTEINILFYKYKPYNINKNIEIEFLEYTEFYNGDIYYGEINKKNKEYYGRGIKIWKEGDKYEGEWKDNNKHGKGKYIWGKINKKFEDDYYIGDFINDKREGKGTKYYNSGSYYVGNWKNNKRNGKGIMYYKNGTKYDGEWLNNQKSGNGQILMTI